MHSTLSASRDFDGPATASVPVNAAGLAAVAGLQRIQRGGDAVVADGPALSAPGPNDPSAAPLAPTAPFPTPTAMTANPTELRAVAPVVEATPQELALAKVWAQVLGIDATAISPGDNFFDLGGDSLMAMRAVEAANKSLGFNVAARRYIYESLSQIASPQATSHLHSGANAPAPRKGVFGRLFGRGAGGGRT